MKATTSVGCDWIHPRMVAWLADSTLIVLLHLFKAMLRTGLTPSQAATILIALLPKYGGEDRPVANWHPL